MRTFATALCALLITNNAIAEDFCRSALASLGSAAPPNIYVPTDGRLSQWRALRATEVVAGPTPMVYLRPGSQPGAVVIKINRPVVPGEAPASTVNLRRRDDIEQCGIGTATRGFWLLFPSSYVAGVA